METRDTYVKLVRANHQKWGERQVVTCQKDFGVWNEYTWNEVSTRNYLQCYL